MVKGLPWAAIVVVVVVTAIGLWLVAIDTHWGAQGFGDVGKAGLQLLTVAILGGAVAIAFRRLEGWREQERRIDNYRVAAINDLRDAYFRAKTVRRTLRAAGFDKGGVLTQEQCEIFQAQMAELDRARTSLERLVDESELHGRVFGDDHAAITGQITTAEGILGDTTKVWEEHGVDITAGADLKAIRDSNKNTFECLNEFLGHASEGVGITAIGNSIKDAVARIQELRLRGT